MFLTTEHIKLYVLGEALVTRTSFANNSFMKFLLGTKQGMTQVFDKEGRVHPATVLSVGENTVTQVRNKERDGYSAVQIGQGSKKEKNINKPMKGHLKDLNVFQVLREFRFEDGNEQYERGNTIDATIFEPGDIVQVSAVSKGKGFQGVVKRHGFHGGPRSHGQKHTERSPGSISTGRIQTVRKGRRMAGRMGGDRVTVKNLTVLAIDKERGQLVIRGAVPGKRGTLVEVRSKD